MIGLTWSISNIMIALEINALSYLEVHYHWVTITFKNAIRSGSPYMKYDTNPVMRNTMAITVSGKNFKQYAAMTTAYPKMNMKIR